MKKLTKLVIATMLFFFFSNLLRAEEWIVFNTENSGLPFNKVLCITFDKLGNKWIGNAKGLVKFDDMNWTVYNKENFGTTGDVVTSNAVDSNDKIWFSSGTYVLLSFDKTNWEIYDILNTGFDITGVTGIKIDSKNNKWISTDMSGIFKFNDTLWTSLTDLNSDLQWNGITSITIDNKDIIWIGMFGPGIASFDGIKWNTYESYPLKNNYYKINIIAVDSNNNKWIGTRHGGLIKFDGDDFTIYNSSNSTLPDDSINSIAVDKLGNKWVGTCGGLVKIDGENWINYDLGSGGLNYILYIDIDKYNTKWIGTYGGLVVFNEDSIILNVEDNPKIKYEVNTSISPNPFSEATTIKYSLEKPDFVNINIYNSFGNKISTTQNEFQSEGEHQFVFDGSNFPSGIYFYTIQIAGRVESGKMALIK